MKEVLVEDLEENMVLAKPIERANGTVLMYEGAILKAEHIEKIKENFIESVFISDEVKTGPQVYTVAAIKQESVEKIKDVIQHRIHTRNDDEMASISETAVNIISDVVNNVDVSNCMLNVKRESNDLYGHMLSVASLATIMGIKVGFSETQLKDVCTGALLHDIGLTEVTTPFFDIEMDRMPAVEKLNYRRHVINGYERAQSFDWCSDMVKNIILSHHERVDGSGYPFHKIAERIPIEVRLVAICDHFDEMVNGIGYKKRKIYEVVEYFRTSEAFLFDYDLLAQVTTTIAWFPTGSLIVTNEGEVAEIIQQNSGLPDRPVIRIVKNADGSPCRENTIKDLTECLTTFIVETAED